MSPNSRVWIYQSRESIPQDIIPHVQLDIDQFCQQWLSHGSQVTGQGNVFFDHFIVLIADAQSHVSGCSIDSSVAFIRQIESKYGLNLFNRTDVNVFENETVVTYDLNEFRQQLQQGNLTGQSMVFDHTIQTLQELQSSWIKPVAQTWMKRFLPVEVGN